MGIISEVAAMVGCVWKEVVVEAAQPLSKAHAIAISNINDNNPQLQRFKLYPP